MLMVWVAGCEGVYWIESKEIKDEEEAVNLMIDRGIWPDQATLITCDSTHAIPTGDNSDFHRRFDTVWRERSERYQEEHDLREYERLKKKYE